MEFLSGNGWVKFKDYNGERIAQYSSFTNDIDFVEPFSFSVFNQSRFVRIASENFEQVLTITQPIPVVGYGVQKITAVDMINQNGTDCWEFITGNVGGFRFGPEWIDFTIEESDDLSSYLFSVPSGLIPVRFNGKISVATA